MLGSIFGEKLYLLLPFWLYFSLHVGSMEMSLRRHCGLFEAVLGSLGLQKPSKTNGFLRFCGNAGFWIFEALYGSLGSILALSRADLVTKRSPKRLWYLSKQQQKMYPKSDPDSDLKMTPGGWHKTPGFGVQNASGSHRGPFPRPKNNPGTLKK